MARMKFPLVVVSACLLTLGASLALHATTVTYLVGTCKAL
jgi:hypothetical protein